MIILVDSTNVVILSGISGEVNQDTNNVLVDGLVYSLAGLTNFDVDNLPIDYEPQKYCYTTTAGFTINPNYATPQVSVVTSIVIPPTPAELTIMSALADMYVAISAITPTTGGAS
jgi:hypothetical protein